MLPAKNRHDEKPLRKPAAMVVCEDTELMKFLLATLKGKNRNNIKSLLKYKQVLVDGKIITRFNHLLVQGQKVELISDKISNTKQFRGLTIIYEDQHLVVIDKHAGVLSISKDNEQNQSAYSLLSAHVKTFNPDNKIFVVHRLDRETSGLMLFAKSENIKKQLQENWRTSIKERRYVAVVEGRVRKENGTIVSYLRESKAFIVYSSQDPDSGEKAITHFQTIKTNDDFSLLMIDLETGKKNQIRVHMKEIGHSVVGDKKYGASTNPIHRLGLHACMLSFVHPVTNETLHFETKIPRKFMLLFNDA